MIKIQNNKYSGRSDWTHSKIRGHSLLFPHDAPVVASEQLGNSEYIKGTAKFIQLHLITPEDELDHLMRQTFGTATLTAPMWLSSGSGSWTL